MRTRLLWMAACAAAFTGVAAAQAKVAVVNIQLAIVQTAEIKKASAELEAKYKPRQAAMDKLRKDLDEIQQKLQAGQGKLTPQAESELNVQAQRKQRDLQRLGEDMQGEVEAERNEILAKTGQKMTVVVRKLADARGLDLVVEAQAILFVRPALDLTTDATAEYDKAYPVK